MAIIVSGNVLERKSARSQSVIAHIMSCSMEPKDFFLGRKIQISSKTGTNKSKENKNTSTHAAVSDVHDVESSKGLLPIATLGVTCQLVVSIQPPLLRLRGSSLQFPLSRIIVISYFLSVHMLKTIFGLVPN